MGIAAPHPTGRWRFRRPGSRTGWGIHGMCSGSDFRNLWSCEQVQLSRAIALRPTQGSGWDKAYFTSKSWTLAYLGLLLDYIALIKRESAVYFHPLQVVKVVGLLGKSEKRCRIYSLENYYQLDRIDASYKAWTSYVEFSNDGNWVVVSATNDKFGTYDMVYKEWIHKIALFGGGNNLNFSNQCSRNRIAGNFLQSLFNT